MMKSLLVLLAKLISGANVRWVGCAPEIRQRIYFANHTSNLDALVIWASLPPSVRDLTRPVAARDYWIKDPLRRYLANHVLNADGKPARKWRRSKADWFISTKTGRMWNLCRC